MAETQSSWGDAVRGVGVTFREFESQNQLAVTQTWDPVVKTITDDGAQATFSGKTGAGTLTLTSEGSAFSKGNRYKLYDTAFAHKQYTKSLEITRMQLMNRDFNQAFDEMKDLFVTANVTKSKAPGQIFNNAFSNSGVATKNGIQVTTYANGKNLASTVHPRVDGGTAQSNASSTGITLTESNFETGRLALVQQLQDDGTPIMVNGPIYVVVPSDLEKTATIITGSELRSGTGNNDLNFYEGGAYPVLASHWLDSANGGSATAWFLVAPQVAKLKLVIRKDTEGDMWVDRNTKNALFSVVVDFSIGSHDWHGAWFSKGDSAAYSS